MSGRRERGADGRAAVRLLRQAISGDEAARRRVRSLWTLAETLDLDGRPAVKRLLDRRPPAPRPEADGDA